MRYISVVIISHSRHSQIAAEANLYYIFELKKPVIRLFEYLEISDESVGEFCVYVGI